MSNFQMAMVAFAATTIQTGRCLQPESTNQKQRLVEQVQFHSDHTGAAGEQYIIIQWAGQSNRGGARSAVSEAKSKPFPRRRWKKKLTALMTGAILEVNAAIITAQNKVMASSLIQLEHEIRQALHKVKIHKFQDERGPNQSKIMNSFIDSWMPLMLNDHTDVAGAFAISYLGDIGLSEQVLQKVLQSLPTLIEVPVVDGPVDGLHN